MKVYVSLNCNKQLFRSRHSRWILLAHCTVMCCTFLFICLLLPSQGECQAKEESPYKFSADIYDNIKKDTGFYWQGGIASSDLSFVGLVSNAFLEYDKPRPNTKTIKKEDSIRFLSTFHPVDARTFILGIAQKQQILIFNEAHFNPQNRVFVASLLKGLQKLGYKYFAAETFNNSPDFFKSNHPTLKTGYYTSEPQFGNLVREALADSFILYPYEDTSESRGRLREANEAQNIYSLLKKDPKAKIVVYCGFDHIIEDSIPRAGRFMAGILKQISGVDPYTLDQRVLMGHSNTVAENPYYKLIHASNYSIMVDSNGTPFNNGHVDALLYSPPTKYVYNRPNWVFENGKRPYFLKEKEITIPFPVIVKVYRQGDDLSNSIPTDAIEIKTKEDVLKTALSLYNREDAIIKIMNRNGEAQTLLGKKSFK